MGIPDRQRANLLSSPTLKISVSSRNPACPFSRLARKRRVLDDPARAQHEHVGRVIVELGQDMRGEDERHAIVLQADKEKREQFRFH